VFRRCNAEPFVAASGEIRFAVLGHASHSMCWPVPAHLAVAFCCCSRHRVCHVGQPEAMSAASASLQRLCSSLCSCVAVLQACVCRQFWPMRGRNIALMCLTCIV
jgi:hypothetical protein